MSWPMTAAAATEAEVARVKGAASKCQEGTGFPGWGSWIAWDFDPVLHLPVALVGVGNEDQPVESGRGGVDEGESKDDVRIVRRGIDLQRLAATRGGGHVGHGWGDATG